MHQLGPFGVTLLLLCMSPRINVYTIACTIFAFPQLLAEVAWSGLARQSGRSDTKNPYVPVRSGNFHQRIPRGSLQLVVATELSLFRTIVLRHRLACTPPCGTYKGGLSVIHPSGTVWNACAPCRESSQVWCVI